MYNEETINELKRLKFEDFIWLTYACLCILNIYSNYNDKEYIITKDYAYKSKSNRIFEFTLTVAFFIYLYFFIRNYRDFRNAPEEKKQEYFIRALGGAFLVSAAISLIYFQTKQL